MSSVERDLLASDGVLLCCELKGTNKVDMIVVRTARYQTKPGGIHVGSSSRTVVGVFGEPIQTITGDGMKIDKTDALVYKGITFMLDKSKKVESILVAGD